jgi:hypothetical protein
VYRSATIISPGEDAQGGEDCGQEEERAEEEGAASTRRKGNRRGEARDDKRETRKAGGRSPAVFRGYG